jgi:ribosome-associated translation inhibitor RaiA
MSQTPTVVISFKDMDGNEDLREKIEKGCAALAAEFPETTRFEITLAPDGVGHTAHGHVTGRATEVAAHADAIEVAHAADRVLDLLEKLLRKVHDKHVFAQRREAQQEQQRRRG